MTVDSNFYKYVFCPSYQLAMEMSDNKHKINKYMYIYIETSRCNTININLPTETCLKYIRSLH